MKKTLKDAMQGLAKIRSIKGIVDYWDFTKFKHLLCYKLH
jgi:hypothetical protein